MHPRRGRVLHSASPSLFALLGAVLGCSTPARPIATPSGPVSAALGDGSSERHTASATSGEQRAAERGENPLIDERPPDPERALPELSFEHLGMHIGGESNSEESKRPLLQAIAEQEEAYLLCYRLVEQPAKGGSFGLDLLIKSNGGTPEVQTVRQKLGGEPFVQCMTSAFSKVNFRPLERPTMVSYSLLFVLEGDT